MAAEYGLKIIQEMRELPFTLCYPYCHWPQNSSSSNNNYGKKRLLKQRVHSGSGHLNDKHLQITIGYCPSRTNASGTRYKCNICNHSNWCLSVRRGNWKTVESYATSIWSCTFVQMFRPKMDIHLIWIKVRLNETRINAMILSSTFPKFLFT